MFAEKHGLKSMIFVLANNYYILYSNCCVSHHSVSVCVRGIKDEIFR